ncbi:MAG: ATP-dependent helicase [Cellulosilyticaceae bacterium]
MKKNELSTTQLNSNQLEAVTAPLGPTMVIAGPGSGKTFVITQRIHYMLETFGCDPSHILVITFTKAAAEEMKERYYQLYGGSRVQFGTFHSVFYKILRLVDPEKYDLSHLISEDNKKRVIEKLYKEIDGESHEDFVEVFLGHLTLMKNQLIQPKYYNPDGISKELFIKVYQGYDAYKERQGLFDFDDMLVDCYYALIHNEHLLEHMRRRYKHILIDEFQDINCVQFEVIKLLAEKHKDLFVVGDDDQSIYQFRGAKPEFLLSFETYFNPVKKVILDVNYRSTQPILAYSNALIAHNTNRYTKAMKTSKLEGEKPAFCTCKDPKEQAAAITNQIIELTKGETKLSECAVIYRTNIQARPLIEMFMSAHIPFVLKDTIHTLYDQWMTKDMLAYLHLAKNRNNPEKIMQIINRPSRYISKAALADAVKVDGDLLNTLTKSDLLTQWQKDYIQEFIYHLQCLQRKPLQDAITYISKTIGYEKYLQEYANFRKMPVSNLMDVLADITESAASFEDVDTWEEHLKLMAMGLKQNAKNTKQDGVVLSTMHSAKGLEFTYVFIVDAVDGVIPHSKSLDEKQLEEERRLLYVGMTRAKEKLFIYLPQQRYQEKVSISPFIDEMLYKPITIEEGATITHKHYGKGTILQLHEPKARIAFADGTIRVIDYTYCIKQKLIQREDL